ncbi:hypothetical protein BH23PLA1_BH23PLA1_17380 [soil metagenome]
MLPINPGVRLPMPTALIVEDEPDANKLLSMLVQLRGYRTESAVTGGEALDLVDRARPDVVFLDLMLPDIDGFEICRTIKSRRETTLIPVVMVTARLASDNEVRSYGVGANDFVPKPYTPDQIFEALLAAEAWSLDVGRQPERGEIIIDSRDEIEPLREFSRLRSLLRAWTPFDEESIGQIGLALRELWASSTAWGRRHHSGPVATIGFRIEPDRLLLSVRDEAGWFVEEKLPGEEGLRRWVLDGPFDKISTEGSGRQVVLVRSYSRES